MEENRKLLVAALVVLIGGNTGSIINAIEPHSRADAFTMTDWHVESDLIIKSFNDYKEKDEDKMDMCRKRITILERNVFYLEEKLQ